jgi:hypothetical protein
MKIRQDQVDLLQDFCDEHDYNFRERYSGRGMHDKECIGFIIDGSSYEFAMALINSIDDDELLDMFKSQVPAKDSMGLYTILYFRNIHS